MVQNYKMNQIKWFKTRKLVQNFTKMVQNLYEWFKTYNTYINGSKLIEIVHFF